MSTPKTDIEIEAVGELSPHNKALYEAGKSLLVESVGVGREFCKFMTTTSLSAIPVYLGLLKLILPTDNALKGSQLVLLVPPIAFLIASVLFIIGYFPQRGSLSLDLPSEIEKERSAIIARRQTFAISGFCLFAAAVLYASWIFVEDLVAG
jgi:hypothetical protein